MDIFVIQGGIIVSQIYGAPASPILPSGQSFVLVSDYQESAVGAAPAWPRMRRDALLAASDWSMVADAPLTPDQVAAAKTYRSALRNLPTSSPAAATVAWPAAPAFIASL